MSNSLQISLVNCVSALLLSSLSHFFVHANQDGSNQVKHLKYISTTTWFVSNSQQTSFCNRWFRINLIRSCFLLCCSPPLSLYARQLVMCCLFVRMFAHPRGPTLFELAVLQIVYTCNLTCLAHRHSFQFPSATKIWLSPKAMPVCTRFYSIACLHFMILPCWSVAFCFPFLLVSLLGPRVNLDAL